MPLFELKLIGEAGYRTIEKFEDLAWYALNLLVHESASRLIEILANKVNRKYKPNPLYIEGQMVHLLDFNHYDKVEVTLSPAVRSMLITQPAVSAMTIFVAQYHGSPFSTATIYALEGITLGLVIDVLMQMVVQIPEPVRNEVGFLMGGSFITESEQSHDATRNDSSSK